MFVNDVSDHAVREAANPLGGGGCRVLGRGSEVMDCRERGDDSAGVDGPGDVALTRVKDARWKLRRDGRGGVGS